MAIKITSTKDHAARGVKILTYGAAGAGKTCLSATMPNPIIISAEAGLLSLAGVDIPVIEVTSLADVRDAQAWLMTSPEAEQYQSICVDSISEIAEVILASEKAIAKDPRQAYGALSDEVVSLCKWFRDLPGRHVYMSAKLAKIQDDTGRILYGPGAPGKSVGPALTYLFDEIFALRIEQSAEGPVRALLTNGDGIWDAKDRSGRPAAWEAPDLGSIIARIGGAE